MPTEKPGIARFIGRHVVWEAAALSVLLRLVAWFNTAIVSRDSVIYLYLAKEWATGHYAKALSHPYHPLYSLLIGAVAKGIGGSYEHVAVGISILASALTIPALALLFWRVRERTVLFLGLMFFCVSPYLVRYAGDILSEPLYLLFVAWAAATWIEAEARGKILFSFVSGVLTGLAYLTRPEGLLVGIAAVVWLLLDWKKRGAKDLSIRLFFLILGIGLMAAPYVCYLHRDTGQWLLTRKKRVGTLLHEISATPVHPSATMNHSEETLNALIRKGINRRRAEFLCNRRSWEQDQANRVRQAFGEAPHPKLAAGAPLWRWGFTLGGALGVILLGFFKGMFLPLGIWVVFRFMALKRFSWNRVDTFILIFSVLYWGILGVLLTGYGYVSRRHYTPVVMFWTLWAAMGFIEASHRLAAFAKGQRWSPAVLGAILLVPILGISVVKGTRPYRQGKYGRKVVGQWISLKKSGSKVPCRILTSMTRVGYYAGCPTLPPSLMEGKEVDALRRHAIPYVVLSRRAEKASPVLMHLLRKYHYREVYRYVSYRRHENLRVLTFQK